MNNGAERDVRRVAGLILAGGAGKRWGGPKAWARLPSGDTFLEACARTLRDGCADPIGATLPPGSAGSEIEFLDCAPLPEEGLHMFDSLRFGLNRLLESEAWQAVVMIPVDHPLVQPETVSALAACGAEAAIATVNGKHGHPVLLSRAVADRIVTDPESGPTLRHVFREVGTVDIAVDDLGVISNCNSPEMLEQHLLRLSQRRT